MRLHLPAFAAAALLIAAPAAAETRNYTVTGFDRIRIDGPFRVTLTTGVAPFAKASGSQAALDAVALDVQGRTLIVRRNTSARTTGARPSGPVTISLGTHELRTALVNGSGAVAIDRVRGQAFELVVAGSGGAEVGTVSVDRLRVSISGTAGVALGGSAETATFTVSGPASINAAAFTTKTADIQAEGASTVRLTATGTAKINAKGLASVELAGRPACTIRPTSSAEVLGCR